MVVRLADSRRTWPIRPQTCCWSIASCSPVYTPAELMKIAHAMPLKYRVVYDYASPLYLSLNSERPCWNLTHAARCVYVIIRRRIAISLSPCVCGGVGVYVSTIKRKPLIGMTWNLAQYSTLYQTKPIDFGWVHGHRSANLYVFADYRRRTHNESLYHCRYLRRIVRRRGFASRQSALSFQLFDTVLLLHKSAL